MLNNLPDKSRAMWESVFREARKNHDNTQSAHIAWTAVKHDLNNIPGRSIAKNVLFKLTLLKSSIFKPDYRFELEITNDSCDMDGQRVDPEVLINLTKGGRINPIGDIDHERLCDKLGMSEERKQLTTDTNTAGLYILEKYMYDNGKIMAVVKMNKTHALYDKYLELHKQGRYLHASAEFENAKVDGQGIIYSADKLGWTITDNPINLQARVHKLIV